MYNQLDLLKYYWSGAGIKKVSVFLILLANDGGGRGMWGGVLTFSPIKYQLRMFKNKN